VAIGIGVVLAGPPVAALNYWLSGLMDSQAHGELDLVARRHTALSERRLARTEATLEDLAARGVDSCRVTHVDTMRQATFMSGPVKELSIVAPDGRTLCTDVGNQPDQRKVLSSEPLSANSKLLLEVVRLGALPDLWVRIRRPAAPGANGLAALMPGTLFLPLVATGGGAVNFQARVVTAGGALIADNVAAPQNGDDSELVSTAFASTHYALKTMLSAQRSSLSVHTADLRALGVIASGLLAIVILAISALIPRRESANPIAEIERALKAGEFVPYFQPIVDIRSGRLRGAEVLIRWKKPDGTVVPPAAFIPLAESSGLIIEMTRVLMRRVCKEAGAALGARPYLKIGFNLTAQHFASEEIVEDVRSIFKKSAIRLTQVVLEVTE
jgi:sensor c-di-GMP phosphodiesterase-like protein